MTKAEMERQIKMFERALQHRAEKQVREQWRSKGMVYVKTYTVPAYIRPYRKAKVKLRLVA